MRRLLTTVIAALACAPMLDGVSRAQTSEKTKIKAEHGKTIRYTGCVGTGTETRTFMLENVVPVSTTETAGTSGVVSTTTFALIPTGKVEIEQHVGHKVEVSGILVPAGKGDTKFKTRTKANGTNEETKGEIERGPMPQLKVLSIRPLAERCSS
jgi:hypothetical protein